MNISIRLKTIATLVDKCNTVADIGTDHGYLPIYLIKNGLCQRAIASDINRGPIDRARENIIREGLEKEISCRLGAGLKTIKPQEADCAIIAGMGGNLIRDILEDSKDVFKELNSLILQPVQNPDVLRKHIYEMGYKIIDEELCFEENKYYEIIKIKYDSNLEKVEDIFYEVGINLIEKRHPLIKEYIDYKISKYKNILGYIWEDTDLADKRKLELKEKIEKLEDLKKCL